MKTSKAGLDLIKRWEGCRLKAYQDSVGVWTIGWGLTSAAGIIPVTAGLTITQRQADDYLVQALAKYEAGVTRAITRQPTQSQFDALVSLCYNIGPGAFAGSTVVRRFNAGDIKGAADAFLMWNKAGGKELKGLTNRRQDERTLFLSAAPAKPVEPAPPPEAPVQPITFEIPPAPPPLPSDVERNAYPILIGAIGAVAAGLIAWFFGG